jgi:hypothetical protein
MKNIYVILSLLFWGCTPSCDYPYRENLDKFLLDEIKYKIPDRETILVFLPLDSCNPCLQGTIQMLVDSKESNLDIVISTSDMEVIKRFDIDSLKVSSSRKYVDLKNNYQRYEIGVVAPMIFHFKERECVFHSETTDDKKPKIKEHFGWI